MNDAFATVSSWLLMAFAVFVLSMSMTLSVLLLLLLALFHTLAGCYCWFCELYADSNAWYCYHHQMLCKQHWYLFLHVVFFFSLSPPFFTLSSVFCFSLCVVIFAARIKQNYMILGVAMQSKQKPLKKISFITFNSTKLFSSFFVQIWGLVCVYVFFSVGLWVCVCVCAAVDGFVFVLFNLPLAIRILSYVRPMFLIFFLHVTFLVYPSHSSAFL